LKIAPSVKKAPAASAKKVSSVSSVRRGVSSLLKLSIVLIGSGAMLLVYLSSRDGCFELEYMGSYNPELELRAATPSFSYLWMSC
jgi:hypothetical protein